MVKCMFCKVKLKHYPEDESHPFICPQCGVEDYYLDERTGTIKLR